MLRFRLLISSCCRSRRLTINVGAKTQISAIPTSTDTTKVSNVTWKSADESIATVEWDNSSFESALDVTITGISKGKTKIYAYQTVNGVVKVAYNGLHKR